MEQLEYWQAIEDGAEIEEEPKKKKEKTRKKSKNMKSSQLMIFRKRLKKKLRLWKQK